MARYSIGCERCGGRLRRSNRCRRTSSFRIVRWPRSRCGVLERRRHLPISVVSDRPSSSATENGSLPSSAPPTKPKQPNETMDDALYFTEQHLATREMVRQFARDEVAPTAAHWDAEGKFPWENVKKMGELGL